MKRDTLKLVKSYVQSVHHFLVSYLYWKKIDPTHTNWRLAKTNSPNTIINNKEYWAIWIEAIVYKDPGSLGAK